MNYIYSNDRKSLIILGEISTHGTRIFNDTVEHENIDKNIESVILPSMKKLPLKYFANCKNLTTLVIPEGVEEFADYCFYKCSSLESLTLRRH